MRLGIVCPPNLDALDLKALEHLVDRFAEVGAAFTIAGSDELAIYAATKQPEVRVSMFDVRNEGGLMFPFSHRVLNISPPDLARNRLIGEYALRGQYSAKELIGRRMSGPEGRFLELEVILREFARADAIVVVGQSPLGGTVAFLTAQLNVEHPETARPLALLEPIPGQLGSFVYWGFWPTTNELPTWFWTERFTTETVTGAGCWQNPAGVIAQVREYNQSVIDRLITWLTEQLAEPAGSERR